MFISGGAQLSKPSYINSGIYSVPHEESRKLISFCEFSVSWYMLMRHIIYQNNLQSSGSNLSEQPFGT